MKTLTVALVLFATAALAIDPALLLQTYQNAAIAEARARPDVMELRELVADTTASYEVRTAASNRLKAIFAAAASAAQARAMREIAAANRARDASIHAEWSAEKDREALIIGLGRLARP